MYLEDLAFIMFIGFLLTAMMVGYIIVEVNIVKTLFLDYTYYTEIGGRGNADTLADD